MMHNNNINILKNEQLLKLKPVFDGRKSIPGYVEMQES